MNRACLAVWAFCICATAFGAVPEAGLKAWYAFDEGSGDVVHDRSGNGNHGKIAGATWVKGKTGAALYFSASNERVICAFDPVLDYSEGLSLTIWAKPGTSDAVTSDSVRYLASFYGFNLYRAGARPTFESKGADGQWQTIYAKHLIPEGQWGFVAIVFDAARRTKEIYVNGKLSNSLNNCGLTHVVVQEFVLGGYMKARQEYVGLIGDARIYERPLTADEVESLYQLTAKRIDQAISSVRVPVKLDVVTSAERQVVATVLDTNTLGEAAKNAAAEVGLYRRGTRRPLRRRNVSRLAPSGLTRILFSTDDLAPGEYEIRAAAKDPQGELLRPVSIVPVTLRPRPSWLQPEKGVKVLNNFVIQLLLRDSVRPAAHTEYRFHNPREGWIFIRIEGILKEGQSMRVSLDDAQAESAVLTGGPQTHGPSETMQWLGKGDHVLHLWCQGQPQLRNLVVRRVPTLVYCALGMKPALPGYIQMNWDFVKRDVMPNVNTIVHASRKEPKDQPARDWLQKGGRLFVDIGVLRKPGMTPEEVLKHWAVGWDFRGPGIDGALINELLMGDVAHYPTWTKAVALVKADKALAGRQFLPYMSIGYAFRPGREFLREVFKHGYLYAPELYLKSPAGERDADRMVYSLLKREFMGWERMLPGTVRQTLMVLGYFSGPPEGCDVSRQASFRAFMEKEMNLLANDPLFFGTYGIMWYTSRWTEEENVRWGGRLYRHYCIEGKTEPLGKDPYELTHIANPDFADGTDPWKLQPADRDSMTIEKLPGIYWLEGRYLGASQGDTILRVRRCANRPNTISQTIKDLQPGRIYSLKFFTADYRDMRDGKSDKKSIRSSLTVQGVDMLKIRGGGDYVYSGSRWHPARGFDGKNKCWINYHVRHFRAKAQSALLTLSDWASEKDPTGPIGQEIMFSGMRVEPYLQD